MWESKRMSRERGRREGGKVSPGQKRESWGEEEGGGYSGRRRERGGEKRDGRRQESRVGA